MLPLGLICLQTQMREHRQVSFLVIQNRKIGNGHVTQRGFEFLSLHILFNITEPQALVFILFLMPPLVFLKNPPPEENVSSCPVNEIPLEIVSALVLSFLSGTLWPYRIRACKITTKRQFSHFSVRRGLQSSTPDLIDCKMSDLKLLLWIQKTVFTSSGREVFLVRCLLGFLKKALLLSFWCRYSWGVRSLWPYRRMVLKYTSYSPNHFLEEMLFSGRWGQCGVPTCLIPRCRFSF